MLCIQNLDLVNILEKCTESMRNIKLDLVVGNGSCLCVLLDNICVWIYGSVANLYVDTYYLEELFYPMMLLSFQNCISLKTQLFMLPCFSVVHFLTNTIQFLIRIKCKKLENVIIKQLDKSLKK